MKKWFLSLCSSYKVAFCSSIVLLVVFVSTFFLYFLKLSEIPNAILLGGLVSELFYVLMGIFESKETGKGISLIIVGIIRYLVIGGLIALSCYLYYKLDAKIFNPFALVGGYFIGLIVNTILSLVRKE